MKKLIIISSLVLTTISHSQNINYGFKFGVNNSNISGAIGEESRSRTSFHVGLFYEDKTSDKFAVSPEIQYSQQGIRFDDFTNADGVEELNLNYISLSTNAKVFFGNNFLVLAGPQIGYLISSDLGGIENSNDRLGSALKNFDYGLNVGFMFRTNSGVGFGVRYYLGLEDIAEERGLLSGLEGRNRILQFSLEFLIK